MTVDSPARAPHVNGWITSVRDDGTYTAEPMEPLSHYQLDKGCVDHIEARSPQELDWLCSAARMHAEIVSRAERESETAAAEVPGGSPAAAPRQM
jgi:hypothetical protein